MGDTIDRLSIVGFKSIRELEDLKLRPLNVLIGANGAGKSNFVDFFRLLRAMAGESLQKFVTERGGADGFFFMGPKRTQRISAVLHYGSLGDIYELDLTTTASGQMMIEEERAKWPNLTKQGVQTRTITRGGLESVLKTEAGRDVKRGTLLGGRIELYFNTVISSWTVYHFHDTSLLAPMRRHQSVHDRFALRHDASNIAAFLHELREKQPDKYTFIVETIRLVAPFFDDFILATETMGPEELVRLEWKQKGSDFPFQPYHLSDGTLRFICLATALLQPKLPATIIVDEPELGLHPYALNLLAALFKEVAAKGTQVIVSTQSAALLNNFEPEDVIVVDRAEGQSRFRRLTTEELKVWLEEDYSLGELWQKNVFEGGPAHE